MKKGLIALLAGLSLSPRPASPAETGPAANRPIVIGMQIPMHNPYWESSCDGAIERAKALGVALKIVSAEWYATREAKNIDDFVSQGVQGILLWPMPSGSVVPRIEAAVKAGIPVALVGAPVSTDKTLVLVAEDSAEAGRMAAQFIIEKLGNKGSILRLEGPPGYRAQMKAAFEERLGSSNVTIAATSAAATGEQMMRSYTKTLAASLIQSHPQFDGIFAYNDDMILGALDAMEMLHIDPTTKLTVGVDQSPSSLRRLKDGTLGATINTLPSTQAAQALQYLFGYIKDQTTPPQKVILIRPQLLTKASSPL
ncbi:MAG TPA: substrate-binding domain-containing protein [Anaeromyxobacter sp.]|nr:substrate-binding domain-containing protein [Anaeromyxobacter sp.]